MKQVLLALTLGLSLLLAPAFAQEEQTPDATLSIEGTFVGVGVAF